MKRTCDSVNFGSSHSTTRPILQWVSARIKIFMVVNVQCPPYHKSNHCTTVPIVLQITAHAESVLAIGYQRNEDHLPWSHDLYHSIESSDWLLVLLFCILELLIWTMRVIYACCYFRIIVALRNAHSFRIKNDYDIFF